ncbi:5336_t:CDS:10 [Paraglomus brasilianum]|uniref:5336_t:CDS:1 n=1 Tax=Paraglomus brasilianum TaxID=144538 RepID=A0A9N9CJY2_9GLOM|nr:5336_t:CDS:10 [Paraglomus brasilianum]
MSETSGWNSFFHKNTSYDTSTPRSPSAQSQRLSFFPYREDDDDRTSQIPLEMKLEQGKTRRDSSDPNIPQNPSFWMAPENSAYSPSAPPPSQLQDERTEHSPFDARERQPKPESDEAYVNQFYRDDANERYRQSVNRTYQDFNQPYRPPENSTYYGGDPDPDNRNSTQERPGKDSIPKALRDPKILKQLHDRRPWKPWFIVTVSIAQVIVLIFEYVSNKNITGDIIATSPVFNPMIGPSSEVLILMGARFVPCMRTVPQLTNMPFICPNETTKVSPVLTCKLEDVCGFGGFHNQPPDQWFRFVIPIFLHGGIIHILFNMCFQLQTGIQVEKEMGFWRLGIVYMASGIFGFVLGGNFAPVAVPSMGASGALFGIVGILVIDLLQNWRIITRPCCELTKLLAMICFTFLLGLLPGLDNFSHIGGFIMGILTGLVFMPTIKFSKLHSRITWGLRLVAFPIALILFITLTKNFYTTNPSSNKQDAARITIASPITLVRSYSSTSFGEIVDSDKSKDPFSSHVNLAKSSDIVDDFHDSDAIISTFDLFSIGIGPSSSHTVGPMRAAKTFVNDLKAYNILYRVHSIRIDLYGSLALTGKGHGTPNAILMGMEGETPEEIETTSILARVTNIHETETLKLDGSHTINFDPTRSLVFNYTESLPKHPNGMRFCVFDGQGDLLATNEYFSIGGGFVINERTQIQHDENLYHKECEEAFMPQLRNSQDLAALPFRNAGELLSVCERENMTIAQVVYENELRWRGKEEIHKKIFEIWETMDQSIRNGCVAEDTFLPGRLNVRRRAPALYKNLTKRIYTTSQVKEALLVENKTKSQELYRTLPRPTLKNKALPALDYLSVYAIAVNEENAAGGRVVTAPTNGAAGVIPAVLRYYLEFFSTDLKHDIIEFLFTGAAIGMLFKKGASISAAEMGCQGEVGVACSMSAAGFAAVMGGTPEQGKFENAAEIGMEHNLGLTCDPIDGLVQIPCIERNALGAVKAVTAAQLALNETGKHKVTLDQVIETMRQTGLDMQSKYKETSQGGLAVNVPLC